MPLDSVGYYALPVIPTLKGAEKAVNSQLKGIFGRNVGMIGREAGQQLGGGMAQGLASSEGKTRAAADKHARAINRLADASGSARVAIRQLNEAVNAGSSGSKLEAASERAASALRKETEAARQAKQAETQLSNARRTQSAAGAGLAAGAAGAANPRRGAEPGLARSSAGRSALAGGIGGKVGGAFMGSLAAVAGVAAVGKFFKDSIDVGLDFERAVNTFSGVTGEAGDTAEQTALRMNKMRDAAKALGADTSLAGTTARDAANAMVELAKGGFTAEQAMQAARGTLQLATAGQLDAAEAAKIQSAAINTFGLNATDATHVADLLAAAANGSSAEVTDLGIALRQGGSVAAGFGVSIEDTLTALTMFSRMGINGSDAGTMLKTSLQSITDQGNPAQGAIEALGLQLYKTETIGGKTNKVFVGLESMMKQVAEAAGRMTDEEFQAQTNILFGSDAMRASMVAAHGGAKAWDDAGTAVRRQGMAAKVAGAQMQGLPGVVEALSNTWESFKLKLFDVLDGPLISIGHWFSDVLSGNGPAWLKGLGDQFMKIGSAIGEHLMPVLKELWTNIKGPLIEYGKQWVTTFKEAWPIIKVVGAVIGGALLMGLKQLTVTLPIVIKAFTGVLHVAQGMFSGIKAGVGVLMSVGQFLGGVFVGAWRMLQGAISAAWSVISPIWDGIKTGLSALGDAGKYVFDTVLVPMWHNFELAASGAWAVISPIWELLKTGLSGIGTAATWLWQNAIVPAWEGIKGAFTGAWSAIAPVFEQLKNGFKGVADFVSGVWSGIAGAAKSALDGVIGAVKGPLHWIGGLLQKVPLKIGPIEIPGAQAAIDLGNTLSGLARGGTAGRTRAGRLWGPGSGTSDSIIGIDASGRPTALVSAGEGVVHTKAMRNGGAAVVAALNGYRGGGVVDEAERFAAAAGDGRPYQYGGTGPSYDCSGFMSAIYAVLTGKDPKQRQFDTESDFAALGFKTGYMPGAFNIGVKRGGGGQLSHMAGTLPNGVNVESGGNHNSTLYGSGAAGAKDFPLQFYLPVGGGDPTGIRGGRSGAASGLGSGGGAPDPARVRESQERVADADRRIAEADARVTAAEQRVKELGPKAKESQRTTAQNQLDKAKAEAEKARREKDDAQADLEAAKQSGSGDGAGGKGGKDDVSGIGGIFSQFFKDTFGLGSIFPDPSQLGIMSILDTLLGLGGGGAGGGGGGAADIGGGGGGGGGGLLDALLPGVSSVLPSLTEPGALAPAAAEVAPAANIDQSTNVHIENPQLTEASNAALIRRTILQTPRLGTYSAPAKNVGPG